MSEQQPTPIYLKDYKRPDYKVESIHFTFELDDHATIVSTNMKMKRSRDQFTTGKEVILLNGEELKLLEVKVNGQSLNISSDCLLDKEKLVIKSEKLPTQDDFTLEIKTQIDPANNKALEGLYMSGNIFCTQNEPEGMRKITYFIDRSDVMAKYKTKIIADKVKFPILLSNGNLIAKGDLPQGKHWVEWEDPFAKPSYLFALVAGDLGEIRDTYKTCKGRTIDLRIYCDKGNESRCGHAMESLKKSMKWDEDVFGLEYDLDIYMIVAVDAFNMGAMENKGLNVFNSHYVLAKPETATDTDYEGIEAVIGHEYFHNWTGNRVTCRDWFQLTLKEGLTVFRDQEFSSDMGSRAVCRIQDVKKLRNMQFAEDAGPTSHPIRPASYMEINNFYTLTVYEKGSEVIRMVHTLIGKENFRKGMDKYFELYDGQAVTTEDFLHAMELASGRDLSQFKNWYNQAGTPVVTMKYQYDAGTQKLRLKLSQTCPSTPEANESEKKAYLMPIVVGLIDKATGKEIPLSSNQSILNLKEKEQEFVFNDIKGPVIPSLNRGFSSPVRLNTPYTLEDLAFLSAHDKDSFNRWEAFQQFSYKVMKDIVSSGKMVLPSMMDEVFGAILKDTHIDDAYKALALTLPSIQMVAEEETPFNYQGVFKAREFLQAELGRHHEKEFLSLYESLNDKKAYSFIGPEVGKRALKATVLHYLMMTGKDIYQDLCFEQFKNANNMTDQFNALLELVDLEGEGVGGVRTKALQNFYDRFKNDRLVICKWLAVQSQSKRSCVLSDVKKLVLDPVFDSLNPNMIRSVYHTFSRNFVRFHDEKGAAYGFIADKVLELDKKNPQIASTLVQAFNKWKKMDAPYSHMMKEQLERMHKEQLSKNVFEIVHKNLQ
jgi:aminopeptidase N